MKGVFDAVEAGKESCQIRIVSFLSSRESALVHSIVNVGVHPNVDRINVFPEMFGVIGDALMLFGNEFVESMVEVAYHFRRFVVNDRIDLRVPDNRNCATLRVVGICSSVKFTESSLVLMTRDPASSTRDGLDTLDVFIRNETPAFGSEEGINDADWKQTRHLVDALELTNDESSVRPRASERSDKVVASKLRFMLAAIFDQRLEPGFLAKRLISPGGPFLTKVFLVSKSSHDADRGYDVTWSR